MFKIGKSIEIIVGLGMGNQGRDGCPRSVEFLFRMMKQF